MSGKKSKLLRKINSAKKGGNYQYKLLKKRYTILSHIDKAKIEKWFS